MKGGRHEPHRRLAAVLAGLATTLMAGALMAAAALSSAHPGAPRDSGLAACAYRLSTHDVTAAGSGRSEPVRGSRWPDLPTTGRRRRGLTTQLLTAGGPTNTTVWSPAALHHLRQTNGNHHTPTTAPPDLDDPRMLSALPRRPPAADRRPLPRRRAGRHGIIPTQGQEHDMARFMDFYEDLKRPPRPSRRSPRTPAKPSRPVRRTADGAVSQPGREGVLPARGAGRGRHSPASRRARRALRRGTPGRQPHLARTNRTIAAREPGMSIHEYLMKACQDDAVRAASGPQTPRGATSAQGRPVSPRACRSRRHHRSGRSGETVGPADVPRAAAPGIGPGS